jgi:aconitate hydratase
MPSLPDITTGEVLLKLGNDITTDHIVPAGANYTPIRSNIPEFSKHAFKVVDDTFADRAQKAGGGFIIGGTNYGQGSSREQAAMVPRYLGVKAVVAQSFARLHLANMVNWGLLPLTFVDSEDYNRIDQGDVLTMETVRLEEGKNFTIRNQTRNVDISVTSPLCQADLDSVKVGGRINQAKKK